MNTVNELLAGASVNGFVHLLSDLSFMTMNSIYKASKLYTISYFFFLPAFWPIIFSFVLDLYVLSFVALLFPDILGH